MQPLALELGIALTLFVSTNIDDIFVLLALFSDRRFSARQVISGQFLGIFGLAIGSIALSLGARQVPLAYIGLFGLIPLGLGLKKLTDLYRGVNDDDDEAAIAPGRLQSVGKVLTVAGVTLANGGDNVGVYVPLFATKPLPTLALYLLVFTLGTAAWCAGAIYLVRHRRIGAWIKDFSEYAVPWVFIALGLYVLYEAGSFGLI